jgi:hypothetical protein
MRTRPWLVLISAIWIGVVSVSIAQAQTATTGTPAKEGVLKAAEVGDKLFPDKVFFRGQSASVQARNTGGVRYADGMLVMAGLVDNSGYSSGLKEKYQAYLITEVQVSSTKDAEMKRPVPLQVVAGAEAGKYRLYKGRDYVEFQRVK